MLVTWLATVPTDKGERAGVMMAQAVQAVGPRDASALVLEAPEAERPMLTMR